MFQLRATKNTLKVEQKERITSGSVNIYRVKVIFDDAWKEAVMRYGVFKVGSQVEAVALDDRGFCSIPWDLTAYEKKNLSMYFGVYGLREDGAIIIPTIWAEFGKIEEGVFWPSDVPRPDTPNAFEILTEEIAKKGDTLTYDGATLTLLSGDEELSSVPITGGSGDFHYATNEDIQSLFGDE